jgi:DNA-binding transcriptional LysR family regulator
MPTILEVFAKKYPNIRVYMRENEAPELERMLLSGMIDIAVTELTQGRGYESREIYKDEIVAVVPPGHILAERKKISLEELQKYPFVSYSTGDGGTTDLGWPDIATGFRIKWNTMYSCKDDMTAIHMVKHNLGVTLAGSVMLSNYPDETVNISLSPQMFRSLGIAIRSRKDMLPSTRLFINCIMDVTSHL